jgi:hypothetical protein
LCFSMVYWFLNWHFTTKEHLSITTIIRAFWMFNRIICFIRTHSPTSSLQLVHNSKKRHRFCFIDYWWKQPHLISFCLSLSLSLSLTHRYSIYLLRNRTRVFRRKWSGKPWTSMAISLSKLVSNLCTYQASC